MLVGRKTLPRKNLLWAATKSNIYMYDFTVESKIWFNIIYSQVSPCTHITVFPDLGAQIVTCILNDIHLTVGQLVVSNMKFFKN